MRLGLGLGWTRGGGVSPLAVYAVLGNQPELILDFASDTYSIDGEATTDFDTALNYTGDSLSTMVDSDGALKWAPHNLALNSASPATQSITVVSGADYTVELTGTGSITLSNAGTGTVTEGSPVEITASTTTLTLTVTGSVDTVWAYRSDLGGMVLNPDRGDSYVPTTSTAVYMPRRNSHLWDGAQWVNEGLFLETEARTNLNPDSNNNFSVAGNATFTANQGISPSGQTDAGLYDENTASTSNAVLLAGSAGVTVSPSVNNTASLYVKNVSGSGILALVYRDNTFHNQFFAWFDIVNGTTGLNETGSGAVSYVNHEIEDVGDGWYRVSATGSSTGTNLKVFVTLVTADGGTTRETDAQCYMWENQIEEGSIPSSLIPTAGATETRAAQSLTVPAANMAYDATAMSFQTSGKITYADNNNLREQFFWGYLASTTNRISAHLSTSSGSGTLRTRIADSVNGNVSVLGSGSEFTAGVNTEFNVATRATQSALNGAINGTALTEAAHSGYPDLSADDCLFGIDEGGNFPFTGHIGQFRQWNVDLTDAGIEEASSPPNPSQGVGYWVVGSTFEVA